ncbi:multicopper oxidase CueO [Celerinatantimonas sp. MCCC 1A17872]|uniref:multicopper oxidase CueO n=1 Tax=Celerinatantimonas sp. MCCC 1A17872 TaxID=3177514 RepID=UPI0038C4D93E
MNRRDFLKNSAALSALSLLASPIQHALAANKSSIALPIPEQLKPDSQGYLNLKVQKGHWSWKNQFSGHTFGVNGPILGPTIRAVKDQTVKLRVTNELEQITTMHWHGLTIAGEHDGGPQQVIAPGATWQTQFNISQNAATCWYHPHPHYLTAYQVAMGIGGFFLIDDEPSSKLGLPSRYGVDDIPVVIQDKRLTAQGEVDYQLDAIGAAVGWFGNTMLTNGVIQPYQKVPRGWIRLRLLNGCNARVLMLTTSDSRPMYVIGSDGGLLSEPVKVTTLAMMMGERFEVMIDTRNAQPFELISLPTDQMAMALPPFDKPMSVLQIRPELAANQAQLPDSLVSLPALSVADNLTTRFIRLESDHQMHMYAMAQLREKYGVQAMGGMGMMGSMMHSFSSAPTREQLLNSNAINGQPFTMGQIAFDVPKSQYEIWRISGMMLHPFHIHGTQFRILRENGQPPLAHRQGFKDTVLVNSSESDVLVKFDHLASASHAYMAHCHLLEHEDTGMMMSFTVS